LRAGISLDLTFQAGTALTMTMSMSTDQRECQFETALGACGVRWSEAGIVAVLMPKDRALAGVPAVDLMGELPEGVGEAIAGIVALLEGEPVDLRSVELDERELDPFRRRVYAAAREIAAGATVSYGEIAAAVGEPEAAREVGAALGRNPFPIVVPCHRVLAATGALHGFSTPGGIATKRRMLEIELAPGFRQQALFG
jgi:methylated-DNA-[protein]-cysteine S-methyltransferase